MRASPIVLAFALLLLVPPLEAQRPEGARIRGVVRDADGDPVPYAFVWVGTADVVDVARVYADAEGRYDRSGLAPACYVLRVQAGDSRESRLGGVDSSAHEPCRQLGDGDETWWNFTLRFVPLVKGFVFDERGGPAIQRRVGLAGTGQGDIQANGSYRIVAEGGVYEYYVDGVDWALGRTFTRPCAGATDPRCVAVPERGDVWLNLTVPWLPVTEVRVERPDGSEVRSARLSLLSRATGERTVWYTQLEGVSHVLVPPGEYDATVVEGYQPDAPVLSLCPAQPCLVVPDHDSRSTFVVHAPSPHHARGRIVDADGAPVAGATLFLDDEILSPVATSGTDGSYDLILTDGRHTIHVQWSPPSRVDEFESTYGAVRCRGATSCAVVDADGDVWVNFTMPRVGRFAIETYGADGLPYADRALVHLSNAEHVLGGRADDEGRFEGALPAGNYSLLVDPPYDEAAKPGAQTGCVACVTIREGETTRLTVRVPSGVLLHFGTEDRSDPDTARGVSAFVPDDRSLWIASGSEFPVFYLNAPAVPGALVAFSDAREGTIVGGWRHFDLSEGEPEVRPLRLGERTILARQEVPGLAAFLVRSNDDRVLLVARADDPYLANATVVVDGVDALASVADGYVLAQAPPGVDGREWILTARNASAQMRATLVAGEPVAPSRDAPDAPETPEPGAASATPGGAWVALAAVALAAGLARRR